MEIKPNVSFSFSKVKKNKVLSNEQNNEILESERDFVTAVEGQNIKGTKPVEEKRELVIPLIGSNNWRVAGRPNRTTADKRVDADRSASRKTGSPSADNTDQELEEEAVKQLIEDASRQNALWARRDEEEPEERVVPLLVQNRVPAGFETDDKLDVSLRPDEPVDVAYDAVPITQFGAAMLRGMGWQENQTNGEKKDSLGPVARPKGLGLGADRPRTQQVKYQPSGEGQGQHTEELVMKRGAYCMVTSGHLKDLYGEVEGIDEDNCRVIVHMSLSGDRVTISQLAVQLVSPEEYKKYSKYLNKGKTDKYKESREKEEKEEKGNDGKYRNKQSEKDRKSEKHRKTDRVGQGEKHRKSDRDGQIDRDRQIDRDGQSDWAGQSDRDGQSDFLRRGCKRGHSPDCEVTQRSGDVWVRRNLKVRVVDKRHKLYREKVVVEDVISGDVCVCRSAEGRLVEGLRQHNLETVVPRSDPAYVMIVSGKHRDKLGEILQRDKKRLEANVQLLSDRSVVVIQDYDSLCEYTGDVSTELDY